MVGPNRQFAVAAVDQHGQPHRTGSAEVSERVERGPDGASGVQHVVDEHHDLVVDAVGGNRRGRGRAHRVAPQIVAVHRHVERADRHLRAFHLVQRLGEPLREHGAAGRDAEHDQVVDTAVVLDDLVRDPPQRALDVTG